MAPVSATPAPAQTPPPPTLTEVTVRGQRSEAQKLQESAEAVNVIETRRARQQTADLGEVLARTQGIGVRRDGGLGSTATISLNVYSVESTLDPSERFPETAVYFDGNDGRRLDFSAMTGQHTGSSVSSWLIALHFGAVRAGGLVYRVFVCVMGLGVAVLSVTGVWIWWMKRKARVAEN